MPVDASIYGQIRQPEPTNRLAQLAGVMQVQGLQQQGELARLKMDDMGRERDETQRLNALYSRVVGPDGKIDRNALLTGAASAGLGARIPALQKSFAEADEKQTEVDTKKFKLASDRYNIFRSTLGALSQEPNLSKDLVVQAGQSLVQQGILPAEMFQQAIGSMPDDPAQLRARLVQGVKSQMTPEQMFTVFAPKPTRVDNGQQIFSVDENPNSPTFGQRVGMAAVQRQATPGEAMTDSRVRSEGLLNRDMQRRGQDMTDRRTREANEIAAGAAGSGAPVLGVPVPTVLPWANQSNPKDANKVKQQEIARGAKEVEKDTEAAAQQAQFARDAQRFLELSKKVKTGGLVDKTGAGQWIASTNPDYAEMVSITARLAPAQRQPGAGATSDFDAKQFEKATVGVDKPQQTNQNIAQAVIARAQLAQEYADFRQTYLEQNGTLQGADRHWKQYVTQNPIFDPAKAGTFALNPKRQAWTDHFKAATQPKGAQQPAAPSPAGGGLTPDEQRELMELRARLGRGAT